MREDFPNGDMWDTELSDFKITNTPFGRDYLKELADACAEAQMPLGFYFSQREWYHPDYMPVDLDKVEQNGIQWKLNPGEKSPVGDSHKRYLGYCRKAIKELCTKYGTVDCWWRDAADWGGMFTEEMWDGEEWAGCIRDRAARPEGRTTPPTEPDERNERIRFLGVVVSLHFGVNDTSRN